MTNIKDVARAAGVSPMTVSRVFNHPELVSPQTVEAVKKAAQSLNYVPNMLARGLVTSRTHTIGVLVCRMENTLYSDCLAGITEEASRNGYNVHLAYGNTMELALDAVRMLLSKQIDGLIILSVDFRTVDHDGINQTALPELFAFYEQFDRLAAQCHERGFPVVSMSQIDSNNSPHCSGFVSHDYAGGAQLAVRYLVNKGHRRIGFLSHFVTDIGIWGERYRGFFNAINQFGCTVNPEWVFCCTDTIKGGYSAMMQLLDLPDRPTAIYCANDEIAVGAINACHEKGVRVPEDISIIGHDGNVITKTTWPRLTTVDIHYRDMGTECVQMLLELVSSKQFSRTSRIIRPTLEERESVKDITDRQV